MLIEIHPYDGHVMNLGLANRLRVIISFLNYCETNNYQLKIAWPDFYRLFPNTLNNPLFGNVFTKADKIFNSPLYFPLGQCNDCLGGCKCDIDVNYYSKQFPFLKYFNMLEPNTEIQTILNEASQITEIKNGFGVHFRDDDFESNNRTNKITIGNYIEKIDKQLETDEFFYFTTDNKNLYNVLKQRYGNRCRTFEQKCLDRSDPKNFEYAYIDMVLLSKTKYILGTYLSTFSEHAARIGCKELYLYHHNDWERISYS